MTDTPQNVDPSEIAKFEELASRWWDKNSEFKPLHDINPLRVNYINTMVNLEGKTVIDVAVAVAYYLNPWLNMALLLQVLIWAQHL
jgi:2-polyprenyl-3-methyl-5-hydroxy-6-metoxy-1,4-benzoquinol methylase